MPSPWESLRLLADPTRARIVALLRRAELAVGELQEVLSMGQSRISTHLAQLRKAGLAEDRRDGKRTYYSLAHGLPVRVSSLVEAACEAASGEPQSAADLRALGRIVERRRRKAEQHFDRVAGRLGKHYCPTASQDLPGQ
ncbi:MAG: ArsR/SmtB family transcription factor [Verrucomicrobiota bacterium]